MKPKSASGDGLFLRLDGRRLGKLRLIRWGRPLPNAADVAIEHDLLQIDFEPGIGLRFGLGELEVGSRAQGERLSRAVERLLQAERHRNYGIEVQQGGAAAQVGAARHFGTGGVRAGAGGELGGHVRERRDDKGKTADRRCVRGV